MAEEQTYQEYRQARLRETAPAAAASAGSEPTQAEMQESSPAETQASPPAETEDLGELEAPEPAQDKRDKRLENRFRRLTDRLRAKDREIAELRGELTAVVQMVRPPAAAQPDPARPQREQYTDEDAYLDAVITWKVGQQTSAQSPPAESHPAPDQPKQAYLTQLEAARKQYEDYDEVVEASDVRVSQAVTEALFASENGPALVYHLAQHPEEAETLNRLTSVALGRALARLETQVSAVKSPPIAPPSRPPEPVRPVGGTASAGVVVAPDKLSYQDYKEARRAGRIR